ncbi:MAG: hypothetical protein C5S47_06180 [Candidatus Methanogasteraceae archaeon]|nr:MAG: hypothetical protein C5S47_06180 [ANME-2 cluster archaeon]
MVVRRPDRQNVWDVLSKYAGTVEGPEDWSEEHDHYLYGVTKRENGHKMRKLSEIANAN